MKYSIDITITQICNKNYVIHVLCEAQELSAQDLVGKVNEIFLLEWAWIGNIIFGSIDIHVQLYYILYNWKYPNLLLDHNHYYPLSLNLNVNDKVSRWYSVW